jgi:hypothetical protein
MAQSAEFISAPPSASDGGLAPRRSSRQRPTIKNVSVPRRPVRDWWFYEPVTVPTRRDHSSPSTAIAHRSSVGPDKGGSRLERSLAGRVDHDQESGLGLAWRPTGPDVHPTNSMPEPVSVWGGGVSQGGSAAASADFGPFSVDPLSLSSDALPSTTTDGAVPVFMASQPSVSVSVSLFPAVPASPGVSDDVATPPLFPQIPSY